MRALARWGITPLLAAPVGAWALGLGNIELKSALNQPFQAQIEVVSATPDELQGLKVALAPSEMFERYGLDRPAFLQNLEFRVVSDRSGRGIVQVTSAQSIAEPFVTLLVEATWPRGRVLREYTVLLDPPVLLPAPATPQAVQPAETRPAASNSSGGAINRPAPQQPARQPAPEPARAGRAGARVAHGARVRGTGIAFCSAACAGERRGRRLWTRAAWRHAVGHRGSLQTRRRDHQSDDGGDVSLEPGCVRRQHQSAARRRFFASAGSHRFRSAHAYRRQLRGAASDRRVVVARASGGQLRLLPPAAPEVARTPAPTRQPSTERVRALRRARATRTAAAAATSPAPSPATETRRPVEVNSPTLQNLQQQAAAATAPPAAAAGGAAGVDLEKEQVFADDKPRDRGTAQRPAPAAPAPAPVATGPSLLSQVLDWVMSPLLWISLGVAALLLTGPLVRPSPASGTAGARGNHGPLGTARVRSR